MGGHPLVLAVSLNQWRFFTTKALEPTSIEYNLFVNSILPITIVDSNVHKKLNNNFERMCVTLFV